MNNKCHTNLILQASGGGGFPSFPGNQGVCFPVVFVNACDFPMENMPHKYNWGKSHHIHYWIPKPLNW